MKWTFLEILQEVATAFPGGEEKEMRLIAKFAADLRAI
jgi:hypothetical protein